MTDLLIIGLGYAGQAIAQAASRAGYTVAATIRRPRAPQPGVVLIPFDNAGSAISQAKRIIVTAAPSETIDPVISKYLNDITFAPRLCWIGYLSTTGVYGNRDGSWVNEDTAPAPGSPRAHRRVAAEAAWTALAATRDLALDIFRLAGIYGPGRSVFDDLRDGTARHTIKPGHLFGRIHRDDIAHGVLAALRQTPPPGTRIFNFADDEPAASADVVVEAARLLGIPPPPPVPFAAAAATMTPMGLSFWSENRRVANEKTKEVLGISWLYPTYREGLAAILAEQRQQAIT